MYRRLASLFVLFVIGSLVANSAALAQDADQLDTDPATTHDQPSHADSDPGAGQGEPNASTSDREADSEPAVDSEAEVREILETEVDEPEEAARLLYDEAVLHYQAGEFEAAAQALVAAHDIDPDPVLAFNAARAWDDAGKLDEARRWYLLALSDTGLGEAERKRAVKAIERLDNTEQALKTRVDSLKLTESRVQVTSTQAGSSVFINGKKVGETPFASPVEPGSYTIRVEAPGYEPYSQLVDVTEGEALVVRAALEHVSLMPWVYVMGGVTVVALGVGIAGDVLAVDRYDSADTRRDDPGFDELVSEGQAFQTLAIVGYSVAGVAGVTTLVLGLVEGLSGPGDDGGYRTLGDLMGAPVDLHVGPRGASVTLTW